MDVSRCPESLYTQGKERKAGADGGSGGIALHRGGVAEIWDVFEMAEDDFKRGLM